MSLPATIPTWATDTNIATGTETGTPTKVAASAGYLAQGGVPGAAFIAPYWNYVIYHIIQHVLWARSLHVDAEWLGRAFAWTGAQTWSALGHFSAGLRAAAIQLYTGDMLYTDSAGSASTRARSKTLPFVTQAHGASANVFGVASDGSLFTTGAGECLVAIDIPSSSILNSVTVGFVDANGGTWTAEVVKDVANRSSGVITRTTPGSAVTSTLGTHNPGVMGSLAETIARGNTGARYYVFLSATGAGQTLAYIDVTYSDVGFVGNV